MFHSDNEFLCHSIVYILSNDYMIHTMTKILVKFISIVCILERKSFQRNYERRTRTPEAIAEELVCASHMWLTWRSTYQTIVQCMKKQNILTAKRSLKFSRL